MKIRIQPVMGAVTLPEGTYEYKFVLNGQTWQPDPNNPWRTGFYQNSLLHVGGRP
jgi:hypothetical protein